MKQYFVEIGPSVCWRGILWHTPFHIPLWSPELEQGFFFEA